MYVVLGKNYELMYEAIVNRKVIIHGRKHLR